MNTLPDILKQKTESNRNLGAENSINALESSGNRANDIKEN